MLTCFVISWQNVIDWLSTHMATCPSKHFFHIDCPGCGMQRSIIALLEGDLEKSLSLYPATIPILLLLTFTAIHIKFKFENGGNIVKWGYIFCTIIIMTFYIYKIITFRTF